MITPRVLTASLTSGKLPIFKIFLLVLFGFVAKAIFFCNCGTVNETFTSHETMPSMDVPGSAFEPMAALPLHEEDEVIEEGGRIKLLLDASDVGWRWDMRLATRNTLAVHRFADKNVLAQSAPRGRAPQLFVVEDLERVGKSQQVIFSPPEVDQIARAQQIHVAQTVVGEGSVVYVAYFSEQSGFGVDVYAVDLAKNETLWHHTLERWEPALPVHNQVQLSLEKGRLAVFTLDGSHHRRVEELSLENGELLARNELPAALTEIAPLESLESRHYGSYLFNESTASGAAASDVVLAGPLPRGERPSIERRVDGETMWRFVLAGDGFTFFPTEKLSDAHDRDVVLSHDSTHSGGVVTSLDHRTGEVIWTVALRGFGTQGDAVSHNDLSVDVVRLAGEPVLMVSGREARGGYVEYIEPTEGKVLSTLLVP